MTRYSIAEPIEQDPKIERAHYTSYDEVKCHYREEK